MSVDKKIKNIEHNLNNNFEVNAFMIGAYQKKELVIIANHFRNLGYKCKIDRIDNITTLFTLTVYRT